MLIPDLTNLYLVSFIEIEYNLWLREERVKDNAKKRMEKKKNRNCISFISFLLCDI
jgi:hypothetical protein